MALYWGTDIIADDSFFSSSLLAALLSNSFARQPEPFSDFRRVCRIKPIIHPVHALNATLGATVQLIPQRDEKLFDVPFARGVCRLYRHLGLDERSELCNDCRRRECDVPAK